MRNIKPTILLTTLGLIFSSANSFATECTPAPDCASLGYNNTETDCVEGMSVKCPTDTSKVYCLTQSGENNSISAGAILYGDGTINRGLISGKKPIGVVFDVVNRLAVALTDVKKDGSAGSEEMYWSSGTCETQYSDNCDGGYLTCHLDGRANTDAILASTCNGTAYAATAANLYQPSNCNADFCQKGKWFLPSMRDLYTIHDVIFDVVSSLLLLTSQGASNLEGHKYWSSNDSENSAYFCSPNRDGVSLGFSIKNEFSYYVRPVVKY